MKAKRCVLAYSGGLDTTTLVIWLKEQGYEVHAVLVDVGQDENLPLLCQKALQLGAASAVIRDARPAMFEQIIPWVIGLGATYEGTYHLGTALARPFIAAEQVKLAKKLGGATLVHGATGKGNDQIRFEFAYRTLAPECPVLAPWRVWNLAGRTDMIAYLHAHGVQGDFAVTKEFSLDENLWHLSVEGGPLEDPTATVDVGKVLGVVSDRFAGGAAKGTGNREQGTGNPLRSAPGASREQGTERSAVAKVRFDEGVPVMLNGKETSLQQIVSTLNHQNRTASWAWDLVIENRFTGIKSRGLYINPAAKVLHVAVDALARTCLNKTTYDQYVELGKQYGAMIYRGEFFSDQRVMLQAAASAVMQRLNGDVTVQLEPVPYACKIDATAPIFSKNGATFEKSDFSHADAGGFIRLTWLTSVGRSFEEDGHGGDVEAGGRASSDVRCPEPVSGGRLVPAAV